MESGNYRISPVRIVGYKVDQNSVSFGAPDSIVKPTTYTDFEMERFLGYDLSYGFKDTETNQNYLLFKRNIEPIELPLIFAEAEKILNETIEKVLSVTGGKAGEPLPKGNYWRYLIDFQGISNEYLGEAKVKIKQGSDPLGPHAALTHRERQSILRVKAETFHQLKELFQQAKKELI